MMLNDIHMAGAEYMAGAKYGLLQEYMCNCDIKAVVDSLLDMNNHGLWDEV